MRNARFTRQMKPSEIELARKVFHGVMPPWNEIGITDGLGVGDTVWTMTRSMIPFASSSFARYFINFGDAANADLSTEGVLLNRYVSGYDATNKLSDVFVHELTHVWQYSRPYAKDLEIGLRCIYAQEIGAGYKFTAGDPWATYNLEQQASIVEKWNERGRKEDDELFPYIHYIVRKEGQFANPNGDRSVMGLVYSDWWFAHEADLAQLQMLLDTERAPLSPEIEPVRITTKDDSFVIILTGDVLFDFNKASLKPAADQPLQQAWAKIAANPRRRAVYINGHTDSVGKDQYNMQLSEQRARAVAQWFFQRGYLTPPVVRIQGFGKTQPVAPNATVKGRAMNRRVEIYLSNN